MNHVDAIQLRAAERYALNQLSAPEAEAFEEHFFSCTECAEEVRWVTMFEANARKVVGRKVRETSAEFVEVVEISTSETRDVAVSEYAQQVVLIIPLPSDGWKAKQVSLATGAGTARFTMAAPPRQVATGRVIVALSARELDPGPHILTLVSDEGDFVEYPFTVRLG